MYKSLSERMADIQKEVSGKYDELRSEGFSQHRDEEMSRDGRWND